MRFDQLTVIAVFCATSSTHAALEAIPDRPADILATYCLDCHDADVQKGEINLDFLEIDWSDHDAQFHWERVLKAVRSGEMPPEKKKTQPTKEEREVLVSWIDQQLMEHTTTGGTVARRLNKTEYLNTLRSIFGSWVQLPEGFPADDFDHGFNTVGESLLVSAPLLKAYKETAATIADEIFPPERTTPKPKKYVIPADELVISYSSGSVRDGAMRLGIRAESMSRSCTWPQKVELSHSGVYEIQFDASQFSPQSDEPMELHVYARDVSGSDGVGVSTQRLLKSFSITEESPRTFSFEAELYEGQTIVFYWADAPLDSDRDALEEYFRERFAADPKFLAGWQQIEHSQGLRGGSGWERVKKIMRDPELDLSEATMESEATQKRLNLIRQNTVLYMETVVFDHFENGPAMEIHGATIRGPIKIIDGPREQQRNRMQRNLMGQQEDRTEEEWVHEMMERFLTEVFRRPVEKKTVTAYTQLIARHRAEGNSLENGLHLAVRTALISPQFLFRETKPGKLDNYDLATRLSYFLRGKAPDDKLLRLAEQGKLTNPENLVAEAERMLGKNPPSDFVESFTSQWLDTRLVEEIMPDPRFGMNENNLRSLSEEVEAFFTEMLRENRPMTDFIDPDFLYTTSAVAQKVYGLKKGFNKNSRNVQRVEIERGGRYGGILGKSAVMLVTANGVDTQPVMRGVWVLENVLGNAPPPPPNAVPAITPDTTGANTPRDLLLAHASEESCAGCHKKIDPVGFALENFDPVGRWREHYPVYRKNKQGRRVIVDGPPIDATGTLPDGTPIRDITDLKRWIVENIDQFSTCLSEKLLTYATGREPNYSERKEIQDVVRTVSDENGGFRDLFLALVATDIFRTK
ncbi:MAG: DUF1588 domain-containing protein [Verrucomicrobiota bacterium]